MGEFKLELQSENAQFWVKIDDFLSRVTLEFYGWPWKTIKAFMAICEVKLELGSGNAEWVSD